MITFFVAFIAVTLGIIVIGFSLGIGLGILGNKTQLSADIAAARKRDAINAADGVHEPDCDCLGCTGIRPQGQ